MKQGQKFCQSAKNYSLFWKIFNFKNSIQTPSQQVIHTVSAFSYSEFHQWFLEQDLDIFARMLRHNRFSLELNLNSRISLRPFGDNWPNKLCVTNFSLTVLMPSWHVSILFMMSLRWSLAEGTEHRLETMPQLKTITAKSSMLSFWSLALEEQSSEWLSKKVFTTLRTLKQLRECMSRLANRKNIWFFPRFTFTNPE